MQKPPFTISTIRALLLIPIFSCIAIGQRCEYESAGVKSAPFDWAVVEIDGKPVNTITGRVQDPNSDSVGSVTVVLWRIARKGKTYVGTVVTNDSGIFCFGKQSAGKYELEAGKRGFSKSILRFEVSPTTSRDFIELPLDLAY